MKITHNGNRDIIYREIQHELGIVPRFFETVPDEILYHEWSIFKKLTINENALPNKTRELIGLGISAVHQCHFGIKFHTTAAKQFGATEEEIGEALWYAKLSSGWDSYLAGIQYNEKKLEEEIEQIFHYMRAKRTAQAA